ILVERSSAGSHIHDVQITNNYFEPEAGEAVLVIGYTGNAPDRIGISDNAFNCENVTITGTSAIKVDRYCRNVTITGNAIDGNGNAFIASGITAEQGSEFVYIGGNVVGEMVERGIRIITDNATSDGIGAQAVNWIAIE